MESLLQNVLWHTFSGPQRKFTVGTERARRYAPGFPPILGFADVEQPAFADLSPYCQAGEHFYCGDWSGPAPSGWKIDQEVSGVRMVWRGTLPAEDRSSHAMPLGPAHADQALELTNLTRPGPFGTKALELGDYFGIFQESRLVAMAGERFHAGPFREISAVCTHPDYQGRGYARQLMCGLIRLQMQRGQTPFLHVMSENSRALEFYARLGFSRFREIIVRVVTRQ